MVTPQLRGALLGLGAAATFGISAPLAKLLLGSVSPVLLAGLLYLGAALALQAHRALAPPSREAPLRRHDVPTLTAVVLLGGVLAPVLMLLGLGRVTALAGSLLLTLEAPFTVLLAVALFREHLGRHAAAAVACVLGGAALLRAGAGPLGGEGAGVLLVAAACACWALDNNLTQRLSLRDPFALVRVKTLVAGVANTALGLAVAGGERPGAAAVAGALALGSVSYGLSVVLDARALRLVGAAREAAWFATAPFVGAAVALLLPGTTLGAREGLAMGVMALGVALLLRERHGHAHQHEALEHEHLHEHDEHHRHPHAPDDPRGEPHSHWHRHEPLLHDHPHAPDVHHRHSH